MIGAATRRWQHLDHANLDPFWRAADETGAVIHIHPSDAGDIRVNDLASPMGWAASPMRHAMARLICAGHVAKYKTAKIFAPMGAAPCLVSATQAHCTHSPRREKRRSRAYL
jgi:hypothetical protein